MAKEAWAPQKKSGESKTDYQKRYYRAQRVHAEETGDQKTVDKIYGKLGKKSHSVDAEKVNKEILGTVATGSLGKLARFGKAAKAARGLGGVKALGSGYENLGRARPVGQKAAIGAKKMLPAGKPALKGAQKMLGSGMSRELESPTTMAKGRAFGVIKRGQTESYHTKTTGRTRPAAKSASYAKQSTGKTIKSTKVKKRGS